MAVGRKVAAIIAEYDPFHNGHRYHIEKTRENGATHIIAIMSGAFTQRGDVALHDKHFRARQAVLGGADLVIELPYPFCCSCAEVFAGSAISIADRLGVVDELSFGCECGDVDILKKCADISRSLADDKDVAALVSSGYSYPAALSETVLQKHGKDAADIFGQPNNVLAIEYIKALKKRESSITPLAVTRFGAPHGGETFCDGIASGTQIRKMARAGQDTTGLLPYTGEESAVCDIERIGGAIILRLLQTVQSGEYKNVPDLDYELAQRVTKFAAASATQEYTTFDGFIKAVKCKSFTYAKAARAFVNAYLGVTYEDMKREPQARVLAFNEKGQGLLKEIKERSREIEVYTSLSQLSDKRLAFLDDISCRALAMCAGKEYKSEFCRKFKGAVL